MCVNLHVTTRGTKYYNKTHSPVNIPENYRVPSRRCFLERTFSSSAYRKAGEFYLSANEIQASINDSLFVL